MNLLKIRSFYIYLLCSIFIILNSTKLFQKRFKVVFNTNYVKFKSLPKISACIEINAKSFNCVTLKGLTKNFGICKKLKKSFAFIQYENVDKSPQQIIQIINKIKIQDFISIRGQMRYEFKNYYLNYNHLCFKYVCSSECSLITRIVINNNYKLSYSLFFHDENYAIDFNNFLVKHECSSFGMCKVQILNLEKYEFNLLPSPYKTNCFNYNESNYELIQKNRIKTQLECINECSKMNCRNSFLFYRETDEKNYFFKTDLNESIHKHCPDYEICSNSCNRRECSYSRYFIKSIENPNSNDSILIFNLDKSFISINAKPYIDSIELYITLFSFFSLVLGINFLFIVIRIGNYLLDQTKNYFDLFKFIFIIKWFLVLLLIYDSFMYCLDRGQNLLITRIQNNYRIDYMNEFQDFDLHVCFPLSRLILRSPFKQEINHMVEFNYLKNFLIDKNLSQLIRETLNATDVLQSVSLHFGLRKTIINFNNDLQNSFFRQNLIYSELYDPALKLHFPQKCFTIEIKLKQGNYYQNLFLSARLVVRSKLDHSSFYITHPNQAISSKDNNLTAYREIIRKVQRKHSHKNSPKQICINYTELKNCSKWECIDQCLIDELSKLENTVHLAYFNLKNYKTYLDHSVTILNKLKANSFKYCLRAHRLPDCTRIRYKNENTHIEYTSSSKIRIFQICFLTIYHEQIEIVRIWEFTYILLNTFTVLIGINIKMAFEVFLRIIELKNYSKSFRNKTHYLFKVLIFIGFLFHIKCIYSNTFLDDLRDSLIVQLKAYLNEFPEINLCFDYKLNTNGSFNGYYLENLTNEIRIDKIIHTIVYLNEQGDEIFWRPTDLPVENKFLMFDSFFWLNKKCLKIIYHFSSKQIVSTVHKHPLKIILNQKSNHSEFYITSNPVGKLTLSKLNKLSYRQFYEIYIDKVELTYNDIFEEFRNFYLWYKKIKIRDLETFVVLLRTNALEMTNHTNRWLPLSKDLFKYNINDSLFEQFYTNSFHPNNVKYFSHNFNLKLIKDNILIEKSFQQIYNLKFNNEHLLTSNEIEREESYVSFLVSVFNTISFWFALSIFHILDSLFIHFNLFFKKNILVYLQIKKN